MSRFTELLLPPTEVLDEAFKRIEVKVADPSQLRAEIERLEQRLAELRRQLAGGGKGERLDVARLAIHANISHEARLDDECKVQQLRDLMKRLKTDLATASPECARCPHAQLMASERPSHSIDATAYTIGARCGLGRCIHPPRPKSPDAEVFRADPPPLIGPADRDKPVTTNPVEAW